MRKVIFHICLICSVILIFPSIAFAGNIDTTDKWAWGDEIGWVNFGVSSGDVTVTDSAITGYAWSENYGWIHMAPATSGVVNDGSGNLSGYAWAEQLGWINFSGVSINGTTGEFSGYASGDASGQISFNCSNTSSCGSSDFKVTTTWVSTSPAVSTGSSGGSGSHVSNYDIKINDGALSTDDRIILITLNASNATSFLISEDPSFLHDNWQSFDANSNESVQVGEDGNFMQSMTLVWTLSEGEGEKNIYVKFKSNSGNVSSLLSASIKYQGEILIEPPDIDEPIISNEIENGDYVRCFDNSTVYFIENGYRRPVIDEQTFFTYNKSWNILKWVGIDDLNDYLIGEPILPKPETVLVKIQSLEKTYAIVEMDDGRSGIRWIETEEIAEDMYGKYWQRYVIDVNPTYFMYFVEMPSIKQVEPISILKLKTRMYLNAF